MHPRGPAILLSLLPLLAACSGAAPARIPDGFSAPDGPAGPAVAGVYATAVTLQRSSCDGIEVHDMPTTVSQGPGATDVTLRHAGNAYPGTLAADGSFTTAPKAVGSAAETHTLTIAGEFVGGGFTATVHADVTRNGTAACTYDVGWVGTRSAG